MSSNQAAATATPAFERSQESPARRHDDALSSQRPQTSTDARQRPLEGTMGFVRIAFALRREVAA
jgi:hypothetical protein